MYNHQRYWGLTCYSGASLNIRTKATSSSPRKSLLGTFIFLWGWGKAFFNRIGIHKEISIEGNEMKHIAKMKWHESGFWHQWHTHFTAKTSKHDCMAWRLLGIPLLNQNGQKLSIPAGPRDNTTTTTTNKKTTVEWWGGNALAGMLYRGVRLMRGWHHSLSNRNYMSIHPWVTSNLWYTCLTISKP